MDFIYILKGEKHTGDTNNILRYELVDSKKSGTSAVLRGGAGALVLGPVGLLAAATATKNYTVMLIWKSGQQQVVTVNEVNLRILMENVVASNNANSNAGVSAISEPSNVAIEKVAVNSENSGSILKRAKIFLEEKDWDKAYAYYESLLDYDPENSDYYLGKLLVDLKKSSREDLVLCDKLFDDNPNYLKIVKYDKGELSSELRGYLNAIKERNEEIELTQKYNSAKKAMNSAKTENDYQQASAKFREIAHFEDSSELAKECLRMSEISAKEEVFKSALDLINQNTKSGYTAAVAKLETIRDYKDSNDRISFCNKRIELLNIQEEKERVREEELRIEKEAASKKRIKTIKKVVLICFIVIVIIGIVALVFFLKQRRNAFTKYGTVFANASVGDTITFGTYEQDSNLPDGKEDIEWLVLDKSEDSLLLISKYSLNCQMYHNNYVDVTWETSYMRQWLNDTFINEAFTLVEKSIIRTSNVSVSETRSTNDKVFLLSDNEVARYFGPGEERCCIATDYAITLGANVFDDYTWWWLRQDDDKPDDSSKSVGNDGIIRDMDVDYMDGSVRPAIWVKSND